MKIKTSIPILLLFSLLQCSREASVAGGTSSTENMRVVGVVNDLEGLPVQNAVVKLIPADYVPDPQDPLSERAVDTTGVDGRYEVVSDSSGLFNMILSHSLSNSMALVQSIAVPESGAAPLPPSVLRPAGSMVVTLSAPAGIGDRVYIPGTDLCVEVTDAGRVVNLGAVPAAVFPAICHLAYGAQLPDTIARNISVGEADTAHVGTISSWMYSRRIYLNTTATGANVGSDIVRFPVAVRLDTSTFDFGQARADGGDIRFTSASGDTFAHELEQWDAQTGTALLWVLVDTVFGNSDSQFFQILWGNPDAAEGSRGALVFDTSNGFAGVWHLSEGGSGSRMDATAHSFTAAPQGYEGDEATAGLLGGCDSLDTSDDALGAGDVDVAQSITLSAWVYVDQYIDWAHIIGKPLITTTKPWMSYTLQFTDKGEVAFTLANQDQTEGSISAVFPASGQWVYVVGVYDGAIMRLYINGELAIEKAYSGTLFQNDMPVLIGTFADSPEQRLNGKLDELRIARAARGGDWIRLCYENQREAGRLVEIR